MLNVVVRPGDQREVQRHRLVGQVHREYRVGVKVDRVGIEKKRELEKVEM